MDRGARFANRIIISEILKQFTKALKYLYTALIKFMFT